MSHRLLTDEVVEAAARATFTSSIGSTVQAHANAIFAVIEGERVCDRCQGRGETPTDTYGLMGVDKCSKCNGIGKIRERTLTTIGPEDDEKIAKLIFDVSKAWSPSACLRLARDIREALSS